MQWFFNVSQADATKAVLLSLHVRLESPNALWRLDCILPKSCAKKKQEILAQISW